KLPVCYDDDDDEDESNSLKDNNISELPPCSAVTPNEPVNSLSMGDEHLDIILATESDEFIKSYVENLVPSPKSNSYSSSKRILEKVVKQDGTSQPFSPSDSLGFGTRFSTQLFINSSDSVAGIMSRCSSPILREFTGSFGKLPVCYDDDDDEEESNSLKDNNIFKLPPCSAVTPSEPIDSLSMGDEHLDTIPATKSDEVIKCSVEDLVPNPKSMLNHDSSIISSPSKIDSLLDEFAGELTLLKSIPPGVDKTDCHPKNEIRLSQRLLYDNSSPRPSEEFNSENSNAEIESFSPFPIPNKDSDPLLEEIDLFLTPDDPMPPSIENDEDSEGDILFLKRLLHDDPIPLPDTLDFSYEVRIFLPFFTYPVTSPVLLSSGSENKIFDPGITINRSYSF
nr:hypothetical protein [Tanacetum cinerariifolium]